MNILENTKQGIFIPYVIGKGMVQVVNKNSIMKFFLGQPVVFCGFPKDWSLNLQVFMFCPGWIRLCISILEVWTGHRHVTEKWEGAMRSLGLGGSLPDYLSHSPAVWSPAGEDMKLWCRWAVGGGGSQSRGQRRLLGAAELAVSHHPSLFQLEQVDAKDVKKTFKING